jgi:repressor LexA
VQERRGLSKPKQDCRCEAEVFMKKINEEVLEMILEYIKRYQKENGRSPSYRDIQRKLSLSSLSIVHRYINELKARRLLEGEEGKSIYIDPRLTHSTPVSVPLVGCVPCGGPILAIENIEGTFALPEEIFGSGELFMLRAQGKSMIGAGVDDGDILVIRKQDFAESGDIVVAIIDEEVTLKRFLPQKDHIILRPENPTFKDIILKEVRILGVLLRSIHKHK